MNIKELAKRIPNNVRSEILLTDDDIIENSISVWDNKNMQILLRIWKDFIEPSFEICQCPTVIANVHTNFRQMKNSLIELENEYQNLQKL